MTVMPTGRGDSLRIRDCLRMRDCHAVARQSRQSESQKSNFSAVWAAIATVCRRRASPFGVGATRQAGSAATPPAQHRTGLDPPLPAPDFPLQVFEPALPHVSRPSCLLDGLVALKSKLLAVAGGN